MREIITIQVGQCGNKIANEFWTKIFQEHKVEPNGSYSGDSDLQLQKINTYFHEQEKKPNHYLPRATLIDLEPTSIDEIRAGPLGSLFGPNNSTTGKWGAGNSFPKGFYEEGPEWIECALDVIRHQVEPCDRLQGFQMTHSIGGGTGSGMGSLLLSKIREEYPGILIQSFPVVPSPKVSDTVVEPYNAVLALQYLVENANIVQVIDNEALFNICFKSLKLTKPTYKDLNGLVAQTMTGLTCTYRFPGELNNTMRKMATNLIPFPGVPFLMSSFSEMAHSGHNDWVNYSMEHVTQRVFDPRNFICSADPRHGRYLSGSLIYRGQGSLKELDDSILTVLNKCNNSMTEWIPDNLKGSFCEAPQGNWKMCSVFNSNSTAIQEVFKDILEKFNAMFRRKAYIFGLCRDGMDEMEFTEAESRLQDVVSEYQTLQDATADDEEAIFEEVD